MDETVFDRIQSVLRSANVTFRVVEHEETRTSEESALARGEALSVGGKALVVRADDDFHVAVLSADRKLDSRALQSCLVARKLRFATPEELLELTGLVPGSVPPFGVPVVPLPLIVDRSVLRNERIAFNAGSLRKSIVMATKDYLVITGARIAEFSKEAKG